MFVCPFPTWDENNLTLVIFVSVPYRPKNLKMVREAVLDQNYMWMHKCLPDLEKKPSIAILDS